MRIFNQTIQKGTALSLLVVSILAFLLNLIKDNNISDLHTTSTDTSGWIAFHELGENGQLLKVLDKEGGVHIPTYRSPKGVSDQSFCWNLTGDKLYFVSNRDNPFPEIYEWDLLRSRIARKTFNKRPKGGLFFSPFYPEKLFYHSEKKLMALNLKHVKHTQVIPKRYVEGDDHHVAQYLSQYNIQGDTLSDSCFLSENKLLTIFRSESDNSHTHQDKLVLHHLLKSDSDDPELQIITKGDSIRFIKSKDSHKDKEIFVLVSDFKNNLMISNERILSQNKIIKLFTTEEEGVKVEKILSYSRPVQGAYAEGPDVSKMDLNYFIFECYVQKNNDEFYVIDGTGSEFDKNMKFSIHEIKFQNKKWNIEFKDVFKNVEENSIISTVTFDSSNHVDPCSIIYAYKDSIYSSSIMKEYINKSETVYKTARPVVIRNLLPSSGKLLN